MVRTEVSFDHIGETHRSGDVYLNERTISPKETTWNNVIIVRTWSAAARRILSALGLISSMLDAMVVG
jgi:hypothetical protein